MKYAFFTAAALAIASAPAYSHISKIFDRSGSLVTAFAPGAEPLFDEERYEPTVIALAD